MSTRNVLVKASHVLCGIRDGPLRASCCRCAHIQNATRILTSTSVNSKVFCRKVTTSRAGAASLAEQFTRASGEVQAQRSENIRSIFRTLENDPLQHTLNHESLHYTVPADDITTCLTKAFSNDFLRHVQTFQELCIMVRRPAIEIMDFLRHRNPDHPALKLVMYGRRGSGKSMTLSHVMHYAARAGFLIVHVHWPLLWTVQEKTMIPSTFHQGRYDQPSSAVYWLQGFKTQNVALLETLKTTSRYEWSKREVTEENQPLMDVVDWGVNRGIYATDCVGVVLKEIKKQTSEKRIKTLVAIDAVNGFWGPTPLENEHKEKITIGSISLVHHVKKLLYSDWSNAMIVTTVDSNAAPKTDQRNNYTPKHLLGDEGFELMDPFIPIYVDDYSVKEVESCLDYYEDRKWIQNPLGLTREGRDELIFKSCRNPYSLMRIAASL